MQPHSHTTNRKKYTRRTRVPELTIQKAVFMIQSPDKMGIANFNPRI